VLPFDDCMSEALMAAVAEKGLPIWDVISRPNDHRIVICNYYQLSAQFVASQSGSPILLLEPSVFEQYPIASHCVDFMLSLAMEIPNVQVFVGEFGALQTALRSFGEVEIVYQEHPLNRHYRGTEIPRDWLAPEVEGEFSSFFSYWKKVEKSLRKEFKDVRGY
jgi:deoxyribodipyrimidine photo-lyase